MRTSYDLSPLHRFAVGFDRVQNLLDSASQWEGQTQSYPPYNIESRSENAYRITMAVAGFAPENLDVTVKENTLVISGTNDDDSVDVTYLHRGIAGRAFERRFQLAEFIEVKSADVINGLLHVELERVVPEEKQPKKIAINVGAKGIEHQAA